MKFKNAAFLLLLVFLAGLTGCRTLKQPKDVAQPLNYTDEDVISSEIERIDEIKEKEPVKALWRAILLGREEIIDECYKIVKVYFNESIKNKDYVEACRYFASLSAVSNIVDVEMDSLTEKLRELSLEKSLVLDNPKEKLPESISDCIKATVTVWVDKGLKVEYGMGMADIVLGSGFFIDKRGYIVTNHHVIEDLVNPQYEGYSRLYIKMQPDTDVKIPAKVIGYDPILDMALLKVEVEPEFVLSLGESSDLHIGDKVSAIGTPIGLEGTLTSGIISSTERKLLTLGNVFQIDTAVNSGNSGGPLIDEKMGVQAIIFAGYLQFQGLNFAIPIEYFKQEMQRLYEGGEISHSWIAGYGRTIKKGKQSLGLEIQYVIPGGAACMTGLKAGDVITEAGGTTITCLDDFQFMLMAYNPGTLITVKGYSEDGQDFEKKVYLEKRPSNPNVLSYKSDFAEGSFIPIFGMQLKHSSTTNRYTFIVDKIIRGGIADETGFSEGDTVTIKDMKIDEKNKFIATQLYTKRKSKGYLEVPIVLSNSLDSPFYF